MLPDDPRHGTTKGRHAHRKDGEEPCEPCKLAAAGYQAGRHYDMLRGIPREVSAVGAARRIQALMALGYSYRDIGAAMGVTHDVPRHIVVMRKYVRRSTAERVAEVYERLCMTPAPDSQRAKYARTIARKNGWAPPLAWDDIDNEAEQPHGHRVCARDDCAGRAVAKGLCQTHYQTGRKGAAA